MKIIDLEPKETNMIQQTAELMVAGFKENWPTAYPDTDTALKEVHRSFGTDRISRIAINESGIVLGWVGGIKQYDGNVWELHPLVVRSTCRKQGIGRALVNDLEVQVKNRGGLTLWLGSDDENNMTTLSGRDLYPNVLEHLSQIKNLKHHPYAFYQKLGFSIVGVLPDANGLGKPDIFMAKRIHRD